jgi:hypothetical protein
MRVKRGQDEGHRRVEGHRGNDEGEKYWMARNARKMITPLRKVRYSCERTAPH